MKLYVLVRKDMPPSYQAVQAGHAVAEWLLRFPKAWRNETLVYVGVKDEDALRKWSYKLQDEGIDYSIFNEPDIGNEATALSCLTSTKIFKNLKLI